MKSEQKRFFFFLNLFTYTYIDFHTKLLQLENKIKYTYTWIILHNNLLIAYRLKQVYNYKIRLFAHNKIDKYNIMND